MLDISRAEDTSNPSNHVFQPGGMFQHRENTSILLPELTADFAILIKLSTGDPTTTHHVSDIVRRLHGRKIFTT
jgi:hypothetical protein